MPDRHDDHYAISPSARPGLWTAVRRALLRRCPNCGEGRLFRSYLKQVPRCAACGERFEHIRSDDAAPWLTILIVGHLLAPFMIAVERQTTWPEWVSMVLWPAIALALCALILPRAKALFIAVIWSLRTPGSERD